MPETSPWYKENDVDFAIREIVYYLHELGKIIYPFMLFQLDYGVIT